MEWTAHVIPPNPSPTAPNNGRPGVQSGASKTVVLRDALPPHPSRVTTRYLYVLPYISPLYQPHVPRPRSSIPILPSLLELPASTTCTSIGGTAILCTEVLILNYLATVRYIHFSKRAPMVARELLLRYVGLSMSLLY